MSSKFINALKRKIAIIHTSIFYGHRFYAIGKRSYIEKPLKLNFPSTMKIGEDVHVAKFSWLMGNVNKFSQGITLEIGNRTTIGNFAHIVALDKIVIGNDVLIADRVFISDSMHSYQDIYRAVKEQGTFVCGEVSIGDGSWIGENVCILGSRIGRHVIVGANSVVTNDLPDYCVAAGIPAKIIKSYNLEKKAWIRVDEQHES